MFVLIMSQHLFSFPQIYLYNNGRTKSVSHSESLLYSDRPWCSRAPRSQLVSTERKVKVTPSHSGVTAISWSLVDRPTSLSSSWTRVTFPDLASTPKVFLGALFKGQTVSHRVPLGICAIQDVHLSACVETKDKWQNWNMTFLTPFKIMQQMCKS